ncbi:ABC transporter substrate-binding protein (plasmid) [Priestia aryabhattai]|uniref:ABC transporter substrate-binding protein n=1 Tax=Priestia aryabhattai TaxID=412384 RepID=UPI0023782F7D|nr:ABC transporter substrate-binding protein [Priestia aryabhattai]WDL89759.1 ABC transporter substrate-binding protein [Priestia aryabhattai]
MKYGVKIKRILQICSVGLLSVGLVACQNNQSSEKHSENRAVTDAVGHKIEVPTNPKRVLGSYLEDPLVALGVTPVAQWSVSNGVQDYLKDDLKNVPKISYDLPFEAVQKTNPDLILMDSSSMVEGGKYDQYSKIAPTYVVGKDKNNDWRKELQEVGKVLNKKDDAQKLLDDYDEKVKDAKAKLAENKEVPSAAAVWLVNNKLFISSKDLSSGDVLYNDLGLKVPKVVQEISENTENNWNPISLEKLADLDADYIFLVNSDKNGASTLSNSIWKNIPAVKNNHVAEFPRSSSWLYTGVIANDQIIDDVLKTIK